VEDEDERFVLIIKRLLAGWTDVNIGSGLHAGLDLQSGRLCDRGGLEIGSRLWRFHRDLLRVSPRQEFAGCL